MIAENNLESHGSWDTVQEGSGEYDGVVPVTDRNGFL